VPRPISQNHTLRKYAKKEPEEQGDQEAEETGEAGADFEGGHAGPVECNGDEDQTLPTVVRGKV